MCSMEKEIRTINERCATTTAKFDKRTALMQKTIKHINEKQDEILDKLHSFDKKFVSKTEFWPVKTLVYGFVSILLLSVVGAIVALVLK